MNYTITSKLVQDEIVNTTVEFEYKGLTRTVDVAHFRPRTEADIENGIINRINSEMVRIDAIEATGDIVLDLNVQKTLNVLAPIDGPNPFAAYTTEELDQKLSLLSADYNTISQKIAEAQAELADNSAQYDLVIAELLNRNA